MQIAFRDSKNISGQEEREKREGGERRGRWEKEKERESEREKKKVTLTEKEEKK